jgi:hypothetical protein
MTNMTIFQATVNESMMAFPSNKICKKIENGTFNLTDYHNILLMIFHQTFEGPSTFALAGAHCPPKEHEVRDYLLQHAEEEKSHWQWVISDLKNTGYTGLDPRTLFAQPSCQAYIAFNVYTAIRSPISRLAIAAVLESIGANYGKIYAEKIMQILKLKDDQIYFFLGHGDTDIGHTEQIFEIIGNTSMSTDDWKWMCNVARIAGLLYTAMYNEAIV